MKKFLFFYFVLSNFFIIGDAFGNDRVHSHGYWHGTNEDQHYFDSTLADAMVAFFTQEGANTVVDFGCGMGDYVKRFLDARFYCEGYDGNPDTPALSGGVASVLDLSRPFNLGKNFDWVVSLEVGEHLPKCYEETFIRNLDKHALKGIVLSWAIEGQGGLGHVNCQNNVYIKKIMRDLGYVNDVKTEALFRMNASVPWFRSTLMVFRKMGS